METFIGNITDNINWLYSFLTPSIKGLELPKLIKNWVIRPRPKITFEYLLPVENENDYCHLRINKSFNDKLSLFFRIGIHNNGREKIENADVRIEKIEKVENNIQSVSSSPFYLHWANDNTDNSRTVYPYNTTEFLDVVFTVQGRNLLFIYCKNKHSTAGIPNSLPQGKYRFVIKLLGNNIKPVHKVILLDFDGNWMNLKMRFED